ncbi:serine/threonine-protein kinase [Actinoallomurus purpureus]|uniref:serine/threonine-protein kinase n=1 Tax=Actinoallomurus purpureus TaxID=478114 RepID=UPI00209239B4|nr:serine/threonine-protein kinase [Actinoallomurus purpureus]
MISNGGAILIIMEIRSAPTLAEIVDGNGPLTSTRVAAIGLALLEVLDQAHRIGIVHRDLKPSNVMLLPGDRVDLVDFDIARIAGDPTLTHTGPLFGSPAYMAPEQVRGDRGDAATDWWALGATLYYAAEGTAAFERATYDACIAAVLTESPPPPRRASTDLAALFSALLDKDPSQRPGSEYIRTVLERVAGSAVTVSSTPEWAPESRPVPPQRTSESLTAGIGPALERAARMGAMAVPQATETDTTTRRWDRGQSASSPLEPPSGGRRALRRTVLVAGATVLVAVVMLGIGIGIAMPRRPAHRHERPADRQAMSTPSATRPPSPGTAIRRVQACHAGPDGVSSMAATTLNGHPTIVAGCDDDTVQVADLATGALGRTFTASGVLTVQSVAVGVVGGHQVVVAGTQLRGEGNGYIKMWDVATGSPTGKTFSGDTNGVTSVALGTAGGRQVVVSGSFDTTVQTWDPATGKTVTPQLDTHSEAISLALATLQGGRQVVAVGGYGSAVRVFDQTTGHQVGATFTGHSAHASEYVYSVAVGALGGRKVVVSAGDDSTIQVSDLATGERIGAVIHMAAHAVVVASLGDRQVIIAGGKDHSVRLWDLATGKPVGGPFTGDSAVMSLTTTTLDGRPVAVAGYEDGSVTVWSLG